MHVLLFDNILAKETCLS